MNRYFTFNDVGILGDSTIALNDFFTSAKNAAFKYIYVASDFPFNALTFFINAAAVTVPRKLNVEFWNGLRWNASPDIIDETNGLNATGRVTFATGRDAMINIADSRDVEGLTDFRITNKFFYRFSTSEASTPMHVDFIGHLFCRENELFAMYPELQHPDTLQNFSSNKINWHDQIYMASEEVIKELIAKNMIINASQLLDVSILKLPTIHAVAHIVFSSFGEAYEGARDEAYKRFHAALTKLKPVVDVNGNGNIDAAEARTVYQPGRFYR